jgi:hypothetical protein
VWAVVSIKAVPTLGEPLFGARAEGGCVSECRG